MDLTGYANSRGGSATISCAVLGEVAAKAGCSGATLYMIAKGHKQASAKLANRIAEATNHEVRPSDLRPDIFGQAPQKGRKPNHAKPLRPDVAKRPATSKAARAA